MKRLLEAGSNRSPPDSKYPSAEVIGTEVIGTDLSPIQRSWYVLFQLLTV